jgi:hypothetical protein
MFLVEMSSCGMIFLPSFTKFGKDVEGMLRFDLGNLNGFNVDVTHTMQAYGGVKVQLRHS